MTDSRIMPMGISQSDLQIIASIYRCVHSILMPMAPAAALFSELRRLGGGCREIVFKVKEHANKYW